LISDARELTDLQREFAEMQTRNREAESLFYEKITALYRNVEGTTLDLFDGRDGAILVRLPDNDQYSQKHDLAGGPGVVLVNISVHEEGGLANIFRIVELYDLNVNPPHPQKE
jgi:hypothetical protein